MGKSRTTRLVYTAAAILLFAHSANAQYRIIDLGTLGGPESAANAINERGIVAGQAADANGLYSACVWVNGQAKALPRMPGEFGFEQAMGINNRGQIVGQGGHWAPTLWDKGKMIPLIGDQGGALGINDLGQATGVAQGLKLCLWQKGQTKLLFDDLCGGEATAINNLGQVVGYAGCFTTGFSGPGAFLWDQGKVTLITGLGPVSMNNQPRAINNRGQVVGEFMNASGEWHGFLWQGGQTVDLFPLTAAYGINDRGQIAGQANGRAALWEDGKIIDLGTLGGSSVARSINNYGEIAGTAVNSAGQRRAVLWRPE